MAYDTVSSAIQISYDNPQIKQNIHTLYLSRRHFQHPGAFWREGLWFFHTPYLSLVCICRVYFYSLGSKRATLRGLSDSILGCRVWVCMMQMHRDHLHQPCVAGDAPDHLDCHSPSPGLTLDQDAALLRPLLSGQASSNRHFLDTASRPKSWSATLKRGALKTTWIGRVR